MAHPETELIDGQVFVQPWPAGPADNRRDHTFIYQYRADRARRTLRGIDQQIAKAENAVAGKTPIKRNRYVRLSGATKTVEHLATSDAWRPTGRPDPQGREQRMRKPRTELRPLPSTTARTSSTPSTTSASTTPSGSATSRCSSQPSA